MDECARYYRNAAPEEAWSLLYRDLSISGRLADAFPFAERFPLPDFLDFVHAPHRHPWLLTFRGGVAGMVYLTDLEGSCAQAHFAFVPAGLLRSAEKMPAPVALTRFAVASALRDRDERGQYILDTLTGLTPVTNRAALKLATRYGGETLGAIPGACRVHGQARNVPGVMTFFTRENTSPDWCRL